MREILEDLAAASDDLKVFFWVGLAIVVLVVIMRATRHSWIAGGLLLVLVTAITLEFARDTGEYILPVIVCLCATAQGLANGFNRLVTWLNRNRSWTDAVNAATAAETAKNLAETAQAAAENAVPNAQALEGFKSAAEQAKSDAEQAKSDAEQAQTAAETAKHQAEQAKTAAETAQTASENAEAMAESAALSAEGFRDEAAQAKADAEAAAQSLTALFTTLPQGGTPAQLMAGILRELVVKASPLAGFNNAKALNKIVGTRALNGFSNQEQAVIKAAKVMLTNPLTNAGTLETLILALETQP